MKESISYTYLLNMMLVFIGISFCVLLAVFSYSKAYRVNSRIASALESSEGYNDLSKAEINRIINGFGYNRVSVNCAAKDGAETLEGTDGYCLYEFEETVNGNKYIYYGITTYISFDFPIVSTFLKLPVYNVTEKIYVFEQPEPEVDT